MGRITTEIGAIRDPVARFFAFARERHSVYLKKAANIPAPWTLDPILQKYKFVNIFRELDRTTAWFREHVRDPLRDRPEVLLATVLFRWFTRITTGEAIFCAPRMDGTTLFDEFAATGNGARLARDVRKLLPSGPYVTGAYYMSSPPGSDKLEGLCRVAGAFWKGSYPGQHYGREPMNWRHVADLCLANPGQVKLQDLWEWLKSVPYQGPFHAYEVVSDLRHTALLDRAPDINAWANIGPGCARGLNRIFRPRKPVNTKWDADEALVWMGELLAASRAYEFWPQWSDALGRYELFPRRDALASDMGLMQSVPPGPAKWPAWEIREVEHQLCEYDKMERTRLGQGRPRSTYHGTGGAT